MRAGGRQFTMVRAIRRVLGRPYLLMAAVVLIIGAIWFSRLALQEFLLLDRFVNVYTNDAQVRMDSYAITPVVTARVLEVLVTEGDRVSKDQVLVRLDQEDVLTELRQAQAIAEGIAQQVEELRLELPLAIEQARHKIDRAVATLEISQQATQRAQVLLDVQRDRIAKMVAEQQAGLEAARARLREQEAALRETEMALGRTRSLFEEGIVSEERLDAALMTFERVQARLSVAQEQVRQAQQHYPTGDSPEMIRVHEKDTHGAAAQVEEHRAELGLTRTELRLAELGQQRLKVLEARHEEAKARVQALDLKLSRTVLRSPSDGVVGYNRIEPGEMVTGDPGDPPILVIHDPQSLYVTANVWESDISRVRIGRPAEVWVDAYRLHVLGRGKPYRGRVKRINPTTAAEMSGLPPERFFTRREQKVPVKIAIEDADPGFRAGMLAEVLILVDDGAIAEEQ